MSYAIAAPEILAAAAGDLATIDSALRAAHTAASAPTVAIAPPAADEVSATIAHLFSQHAQDYQAIAGNAAAFHEQFIQHLSASAGLYADTEAANAASLRSLEASTGPHTSANARASQLPLTVEPSEVILTLLLMLLPLLLLASPLLLAVLLISWIRSIGQ